MILKASQRSGAKQLALHLLNSADNEHVTVHELKGFISDNVVEAFQEVQAVARATKCTKFLFSLSLNPPSQEQASIQDFEEAIARIENELNIKDQPRAIVFHEKEGRRHGHCVWSRIDGDNMKAIKLPYFKKRLNGIAKDLFIEHGWDLPKGFISPLLRDPLNFSLAEWQQAKRHGIDPRETRHAIQTCWKMSDSKLALRHALNEKGFFLAQGDRRGFVVLDWRGEVYSLSRSLGIKAKEIKTRLGDHSDLPSVEETHIMIADQYHELHQKFTKELSIKHEFNITPLKGKRSELQKAHSQARATLKTEHNHRANIERQARQSKIRKGFLGLWDFLTGKSSKQRKQNELETKAAMQRDRKEKEALILRQLEERQKLQQQLRELREKHQRDIQQLSDDMSKDINPELLAQIRNQQRNRNTLGL
ncbi:MAG: relaxase/mobilization nuclease domain-containing protein [Aestuariibacter sp.]